MIVGSLQAANPAGRRKLSQIADNEGGGGGSGLDAGCFPDFYSLQVGLPDWPLTALVAVWCAEPGTQMSICLAQHSLGLEPDTCCLLQDWDDWMQGVYQEPTYGGNQINSIGVIFWLLHAIGIFSMAFL